MICTTYYNLYQLGALLFFGVPIFVNGTPISTFSGTSYTADANGTRSVIVVGDDSGTKVGIGTGPSVSDSNPISSVVSSPGSNTPQKQSVFFIPAGQDRTISTGNTVIHTRSGSGTGTASQITSTNGGSQSFAGGFASSSSQNSNKNSPNDDYNYNNDGYEE